MTRKMVNGLPLLLPTPSALKLLDVVNGNRKHLWNVCRLQSLTVVLDLTSLTPTTRVNGVHPSLTTLLIRASGHLARFPIPTISKITPLLKPSPRL